MAPKKNDAVIEEPTDAEALDNLASLTLTDEEPSGKKRVSGDDDTTTATDGVLPTLAKTEEEPPTKNGESDDSEAAAEVDAVEARSPEEQQAFEQARSDVQRSVQARIRAARSAHQREQQRLMMAISLHRDLMTAQATRTPVDRFTTEMITDAMALATEVVDVHYEMEAEVVDRHSAELDAISAECQQDLDVFNQNALTPLEELVMGLEGVNMLNG